MRIFKMKKTREEKCAAKNALESIDANLAWNPCLTFAFKSFPLFLIYFKTIPDVNG